MAKTLFTEGNPAQGISGTRVVAAWLNKMFGTDGHRHDGLDEDGQAPDISHVGEILMFAGASIPSAWLLCDGAAVSRTTYAALFAVIGATFGNGNGSTTFNLPGLRGRSPIGTGQGSGLSNRNLGDSAGEEDHTLTEAEMPAHTHGWSSLGTGIDTGSGWPYGAQGGTVGINLSKTGGGRAHNNMQPFLAVNFAIKY